MLGIRGRWVAAMNREEWRTLLSVALPVMMMMMMMMHQ